MGKQAGPSPEELEFIFDCFSRGLSDKEVLDEMQDTEFPVRNPRFMRERRKEFNTAKKVLETTLRRQVDPFIAKAREEHLNKLHSLIKEWHHRILPAPDIQNVVFRINEDVYFSWLKYQELMFILDEDEDLAGSWAICLEEHLPYPSLWKMNSAFLKGFDQYHSGCINLAKEIRKVGEEWGVVLGPEFERPVIFDIDRVHWTEKHPKGRHVMSTWKHRNNILLAGYGRLDWNILEVENPLSFVQK